ncbi:MAG: ankyrin repeat domain-containing protein [Acidobacteriota bacterium]
MTLVRYLLPVVLVLLGVGRATADSVEPTARQPFFLGGIQLNEDDHQRWSAALTQAGMNTVQVTAYAHQGPWHSAELWYAEQEPSVLAEIRAARANGLQVVLVLRVALDHNDPANRFLWHGLVYPRSEAQLALWFRRYTEFVVKWARIAKKEGVQVLGVASEMNALAATLPVEDVPELAAYYLDDVKQHELRQLVERHAHLFTDEVRSAMGAGDFASLDEFLRQRNEAERRWARSYTFAEPGTELTDEARVEHINRRRQRLQHHWRELIGEVRKVYRGWLTLAANFDNYHEVGFWKDLDLMGINAYFPLRASLDSPLDVPSLTASWRNVFEAIDAFRATHGLTQKVVFTELGYTQRRGVTFAPWSSRGFVPIWDGGEEGAGSVLLWSAQPIVPEERALAVRALYDAWQQTADSSLVGVLYWKLSSRLELARYEPFMLYLGREVHDPLFDALTLFADPIRPFTNPLAFAKPRYAPWADAILRGDVDAIDGLSRRHRKARPPAGQLPPLHLAVQAGQTPIVRRLVERGVSPKSRDRSGRLPAHWACYQQDVEIVSLLLPPARVSWRDDLGETPHVKCARLDNVAVMGELLRHRPEPLHEANILGQTPLRLAAAQASLAMVELLLDHGARVDDADSDGVTPLHIAARRGEPRIVARLAEASEREARDHQGHRPTHYAAYYGQREAFDLLWKGREAGRLNRSGQSLLHLAAHGGDTEILQRLLRHDFDIDLKDVDGRTPLHFATMKTHRAAAALLLEHGADARLPDGDGQTVAHSSAASSDSQLLQLFLTPSTLDLPDRAGNTPLHHAAGWGRVENVRLLLAAGASPELANDAGQTALEVARESGRKRVVELMRQ